MNNEFTFKERLVIKLIKFLVEFIGHDVDHFWITKWREVFNEADC